jgi:hypothetical protein
MQSNIALASAAGLMADFSMSKTLEAGKTYSESDIAAAISSGECKLGANELATVTTNEGWTALHVAARKGILSEIFGGANLSQLARCLYLDDFESALETAANHGHANKTQIKCNENAETLSEDNDTIGFEPPVLHVVAKLGLFSLVEGGVTVAQLANAKDAESKPALHCAAEGCKLDKIPPNGVTCAELASAKDACGFSALRSAVRAKCLNQVSDKVTAKALAADREDHSLSGITSLHQAACDGVLGQVDGLDMKILIETADSKGERFAMADALENMDPADYNKTIPDFSPQALPKSVLLSDSHKVPGYCLLQYLLTWEKLPKGFVCSNWLDWAAAQKKSVWNIPEISKDCAVRFLENVEPGLMLPWQKEAKALAALAATADGKGGFVGRWLMNFMIASQNSRLPGRI